MDMGNRRRIEHIYTLNFNQLEAETSYHEYPFNSASLFLGNSTNAIQVSTVVAAQDAVI